MVSLSRAALLAVLFVLCLPVEAAADERALIRRAQRAFAQGKYAQAEPLYLRALKEQEVARGPEHREVATTLDELVRLYVAQGAYEQAQPHSERALAIKEKAWGPDHLETAASLHNRAHLHFAQGDYEQAEALFHRALRIRDEAHHPETATTLNSLARLYQVQGKYSQAEPLFQRALKLKRAALGEKRPEAAPTRGAYAQAEPLLPQALKAKQAAPGSKPPDVASMLTDLARLHFERGEYERSEQTTGRPFVKDRARSGLSNPVAIAFLDNFHRLWKAQQEYAAAEPLIPPGSEAANTRDPEAVAAINTLAAIQLTLGNFAEPVLREPLLEDAMALAEAALGPVHPEASVMLNKMGHRRLARQSLATSLQLFDQALASSEQHLRQEVLNFSEERMTHLLDQLRVQEEKIYALISEHPHDARVRDLALSVALLRKGRSMEEVSITSRIIFSRLSLAERETYNHLRRVRSQFVALSFDARGSSRAERQQRLKALTEQANALEEQLVKSSAPLRDFYALPPPKQLPERIAAALPQDGVLVEFVASHVGQLTPQPNGPPVRSPGEPHYLALLLFPNRDSQAVDLGPAAPIDAAVQRLHTELSGSNVSSLNAAKELYTLVFRPLVPHLGTARRLFLAPDGQLSLVPFDALHDGERFVLEGWELTYLGSGKDLLRQPARRPAPRSVVVLADPEFSAPAAPPAATSGERSADLKRFFSALRPVRAGLSWVPLPATRDEAQAIQRLLPWARLLLGPEASKAALLTLETPAVLHIATHGYFLRNASAPLASFPADTRGVVSPGLVNSDQPWGVTEPLLRSGLVLAGANVPEASSGESRPEDSLVTALELAGLNLWGTQLVVLSACETGLGDVKPGQGVYGLRRALGVAGAETVVTSLWRVKDGTAAELMEGYYRRLLAGQGRVQALREAMRELHRKRPHPYYWAPFIAIGQDTPLRGLAP